MAFQSALESYPDHVHAIGMISVENGNMDLAFGHVLAALLRVDRQLGMSLYLTPQSANARLSLVKTAGKYVYRVDDEMPDNVQSYRKAVLARLKEYLERATALTGKRHEIIHHQWGTTKTETGHERVSTQGLNAEPKEVQLSQLENLITRFRNLTFEVWKFSDEIRKEELERLLPILNAHTSGNGTPPPLTPA